MVQLRDVWAEEIEAALAGKKTAKQALDDGGRARQRDAAPVRAHGDAVVSQIAPPLAGRVSVKRGDRVILHCHYRDPLPR